MTQGRTEVHANHLLLCSPRKLHFPVCMLILWLHSFPHAHDFPESRTESSTRGLPSRQSASKSYHFFSETNDSFTVLQPALRTDLHLLLHQVVPLAIISLLPLAHLPHPMPRGSLCYRSLDLESLWPELSHMAKSVMVARSFRTQTDVLVTLNSKQ